MDYRIGDAAGEHHYMRRGNYSAWIYVVAAAIGLCAGVFFLTVGLLEAAFDVQDQPVVWLIALPAAGGIGFAAFWDRWRVIEAFSSRFCTGVANLSLIIVTPISLFYALTRAVLKLARQEHRLAAHGEYDYTA